MREWVVYALIMTAVLLLLVSDNIAGAVAGVLISGPLYLAFGAVLAKFGYQRKTMKELRAERETRDSEKSDTDPAPATKVRGRPAPTARTQSGTNRPKGKKRR